MRLAIAMWLLRRWWKLPVNSYGYAPIITHLVAEKFTSGNAIPVERITITRSELIAASFGLLPEQMPPRIWQLIKGK